jgi:glycosyltransferase involved in cell wall biosynthesis
MDTMKILHLIDSLDFSDSARQIQLLAPTQSREGASVEICCLGPDTPFATPLRQAGVTVHALGWTRWVDFTVLWNLREVLRDFSPDVVHAWRLPALRALAVVARKVLSQVVMSAPLPGKGKLAWWDRQLLKSVRCVAVAGESDQQRCIQEGLVSAALRVIPPAVQNRCQVPFHEKGPDTFSIVCVGEGFEQALVAFDMLLYLLPEMKLHIVGAGSRQAELLALAQGLKNTSVHFQDAHADVANLLESAAVVWVSSKANAGQQFALEAMALGRAVVASDVPCLREVIRDGATGYLAPVGDAVTRARRTLAILQDDELRACLGETARQEVERRYSLEDAVARWRELYVAVSDGSMPLAA